MHYRATSTDLSATAMHVVRQPVRMRCLELCLHDATCSAVSYKTGPDPYANCALYDQQPAENTLINNSEWNLVVLL